MRDGLLTESSCVCWLGEIFRHFPVDIKSEKRREKRKQKGEKGVRKNNSKCKHYVLRKAAHSVPIVVRYITAERWNISSGRGPSQTASDRGLRQTPPSSQGNTSSSTCALCYDLSPRTPVHKGTKSKQTYLL